MLDKLLAVHALLSTGHKHIEFSIVKNTEKRHRNALAESVDEGI